MTVKILVGDCRDVLRTLPDESVHACVTDPPYHLTTGKKGGTGPASVNLNTPQGRARVTTGFMGMQWDGGDVAMRPETWAEVLRVLKPGAYLLAFSGTRTYHRMVCAIEDAGFEIRDQIGWLFGSGFPKSHNGEWGGTALKPAWEPIVLARKPLAGTVEANWRAHETGALNIDACRVEYAGTEDAAAAAAAEIRSRQTERNFEGWGMQAQNLKAEDYAAANAAGRWPANVIHDGSEEVLAAFPDAEGQSGAVTGMTVCIGPSRSATPTARKPTASAATTRATGATGATGIITRPSSLPN
jgi:site-specific DNA-methyltransferase (adenine-specific)